MTEQVTTAAAAPRCLGRLMARELTAGEIEAVGGGTSYTMIENFRWVDDQGNAEFEYGDKW
ncbi:MAG TPA: hypothetical protein VF688_00780 [Allosphingosinicella sp.]